MENLKLSAKAYEKRIENLRRYAPVEALRFCEETIHRLQRVRHEMHLIFVEKKKERDHGAMLVTLEKMATIDREIPKVAVLLGMKPVPGGEKDEKEKPVNSPKYEEMSREDLLNEYNRRKQRTLNA